ncbi:hypothetical protein R1flu_027183 [Riccia fluitans]|uniref:Uncharacterized protein n=1 Tax=Riccia fluitans TaxID=41844 RepID=A0ABD1XI70_9MARC
MENRDPANTKLGPNHRRMEENAMPATGFPLDVEQEMATKLGPINLEILLNPHVEIDATSLRQIVVVEKRISGTVHRFIRVQAWGLHCRLSPINCHQSHWPLSSFPPCHGCLEALSFFTVLDWAYKGSDGRARRARAA